VVAWAKLDSKEGITLFNIIGLFEPIIGADTVTDRVSCNDTRSADTQCPGSAKVLVRHAGSDLAEHDRRREPVTDVTKFCSIVNCHDRRSITFSLRGSPASSLIPIRCRTAIVTFTSVKVLSIYRPCVPSWTSIRGVIPSCPLATVVIKLKAVVCILPTIQSM